MSEIKTFILKSTKDLSSVIDPIYQYFDKVKDEPLQVVVGRQSAFDKKTHPQLKYYYKVVIPTLAALYRNEHGFFLENPDLAIKFRAGFGEPDVMTIIINSKKVPLYYFKEKSKADATILELGQLIDCAKEWAIELSGVIPEPMEAI
jgi:hypothetical protein